jgi:ATP-dependent helicase/nuclease subunit B
VETARTLVAARPPLEARAQDAVTLDPGIDRLRATELLQRDAAVRQRARRDPFGFRQTVSQFVATVHALARAHAAQPPAEREAWGLKARGLMAPIDGPGADERRLARLALEWVLASGPWPTDVLFAMPVRAWAVVQVGGPDALLEAVMHGASLPGLVVDADVRADDPLAAVMPALVQRAVCPGFEDEAEQAAAQVLALLQQGCQPVGLVAQDRLLVRRISALLLRREVAVADETGWKLSTTRAAAGVMALLRAARPQASADDLLDWLKSVPPGGLVPHESALVAFERALRQAGCHRVGALETVPVEGPAADLRDGALALLQTLAQRERQPLAGWWTAMREALVASGQWQTLEQDAAGQQVLRALRLSAAGDAWSPLGLQALLSFADFVQAVDDLLEEAVFEPPVAGTPAVVITPLRRALLRPFGALVFPGADDKHLGAAAVPDGLLGESLAVALGLPPAAERERRESLALAQLLRLPEVVFLHRHQDEGEVVAPSPLLDRLALHAARRGEPLAAAVDPRQPIALAVQPQTTPRPRAGHRLPAALSASQIEALRDCPYRFFARAMLRLSEPEELDDEVEKRDYGSWLHEVLWRFHGERPSPRPAEEDLARLRHWADDVQARMGLDAAAFLPFAASFQRFAPRYVEWLHRRDAQGQQWRTGEADRRVEPAELEGLALRGRIDRIDERREADGRTVRQLVDYKTGSSTGLKQRVAQPLEDTQLAFYAALELLGDAPPEALEALYLAVDDSSGIVEVPHAEVEDTARQLVQELAVELKRIRQGEPLPALGEGSACEHCEMRGLCRRDHWAGPLAEEGDRP